MEKNNVTKATLGRLPMYLKYLENISVKEYPYISAPKIAQDLGLGAVQVRKDLSCISLPGRPKLGFKTEELIRSLNDFIGSSRIVKAVVVGAGKLGRALSAFDGFEQYGVHIVAAFDKIIDENEPIAKVKIIHIEQLESFCVKNNVKIGIITTDDLSAQQVCEKLISAGVTAIWNFTSQQLKTPRGVICKNENLALSLAHLSNQLLDLNK